MTDKHESNKRRPRHGNVIALVVLCLTTILCVEAIALDGGRLLVERRHAQAVADAAAAAAAVDLLAHFSTNAGLDLSGTGMASGLTTANANGYTNDGISSTVAVTFCPNTYQTGPSAGQPIQAGSVEVSVTYNEWLSFGRLFGSSTIPVRARAVAGVSGLVASPAGIISLSPSGADALLLTGSGSVTVTGGAIMVDSSDSQAARISGSGTIKASSINIVGNDRVTGSGQFTGTINRGIGAVADPLAQLTEPTTSGMTIQNGGKAYALTGSTAATVQPGVYVGGISLSGSGSLTLAPGVYYLEGGGFSATGSGSITGSGVVIFNGYNGPSSGPISLTGSGSVNLSPPLTGPYQGITIFQDRASTSAISMSGSGGMNVTGTLYAPNAAFTMTGSGSTNIMGSQLIGSTVVINGSGSIYVNWSTSSVARTVTWGITQ
jgi:hypothetical protein